MSYTMKSQQMRRWDEQDMSAAPGSVIVMVTTLRFLCIYTFLVFQTDYSSRTVRKQSVNQIAVKQRRL